MAAETARDEAGDMMKHPMRPILTLAFFSLLLAAGPVAAKPWGIRLIEPPGGQGSTQLQAINAQGDVVGDFTLSGGAPRAFVNRNGVSTALPVPDGTTGSGASGINAAGSIVGFCLDTNLRACLWENGNVTILPVPAGARNTKAYAINDSGLIVGSYTDASFDSHVCIWSGGNLVYPVKPMGATDSEAVAVGGDGKYAGYCLTASAMRACLWSNSATVATLDLPQGATDNRALAMNGIGLAVGTAWSSVTTEVACLWQGTAVQVLPSPGLGGSSAMAVNGINQIVGDFYPESQMTSRAWFWEADEPELLPLPAGAVSSSATAINDAGQIAANYDFPGESRGAVVEEAGRPTVKITGRKRVSTSKPKITLRGTTTDFVDQVSWKGKGQAGKAKGTAAWRFTCRPKPGRNALRVIAKGPGGVSKPARVLVVR